MVGLEAIVGDRYEIRGELGRGGTATVFRAYDKLRQDEVALKVIQITNEDIVTREVAALHKLSKQNNPNVVQIYDADIRDNHLLISEEIVEGETLFDYVLKMKFYHSKLSLVGKITSGLAAIHKAGLIHRDLHPWNIIVTPKREVKIIDLGKSSDKDEILNSLGSGFFSSPEQLKKIQGEDIEVGMQSDVYCAGIIFYYIDTKNFPYHNRFSPGEFSKEKEARIKSEVQDCTTSGVPVLRARGLKKLVHKCMNSRPYKNGISMDNYVQTAIRLRNFCYNISILVLFPLTTAIILNECGLIDYLKK